MPKITYPITGQNCIFDLEDFIEYSQQGLSVCTKPDGYRTLVFSSGSHKTRYFCRIIMKCPPDKEVDHKDGNTLNNSKENLRIVNSTQNKHNTVSKGTRTLPKGVSRHGRHYRAKIYINYKQISLGTFSTIDRAEQAYKEAADKYFGEFALHNSRSKL